MLSTAVPVHVAPATIAKKTSARCTRVPFTGDRPHGIDFDMHREVLAT